MKTNLPQLDFALFRAALADSIRQRSPLPLMRIMYVTIGLFQIPLPGFRAYVVGGPTANRKILVSDRARLLWRTPGDPVTNLLRQGVLVVDGEEHDQYRSLMEPVLAPGMLRAYTERILSQVARVTAGWKENSMVDMLVESRKIALLVIMDTLFSVDFWPDMTRLWKPILKTIEFISPGAWILFPRLPRPGYKKYIHELDTYLYQLIQTRRNQPPKHDLLGHLIEAGLDDDRIRDQMLTMLIAGHDTSTALLAWSFYLLGTHPDVLAQLESDLAQALHGESPSTPSGWQPALLDEVIKEALRLYPPIHLGNRRVQEEIEFPGGCVPEGERLIYSIYLTHRDPAVWDAPDDFVPERFAHGRKTPPFSYVPFGGGPRACIGAAFGQAEARLVLASLLNSFHFDWMPQHVHAHMGATLEPRPGVLFRVKRKTQ